MVVMMGLLSIASLLRRPDSFWRPAVGYSWRSARARNRRFGRYLSIPDWPSALRAKIWPEYRVSSAPVSRHEYVAFPSDETRRARFLLKKSTWIIPRKRLASGYGIDP